MDWLFNNDCPLSDHNQRTISTDQSGRLRNPSAVTIPITASGQPFEIAVERFFSTGSGQDIAMPGGSLCPFCAASMHERYCQWRLLPWTSLNAPDRLFFKIAAVAVLPQQHEPATFSPTLTLGVEYSLVGVAYHTGCGLNGLPNHFVSQFRSRGSWLKYDCMDGGCTTSSVEFDRHWHANTQHLVVYLRSSLVAATSRRLSSSVYQSVSGRQARHLDPSSASDTRQDHVPTSASSRQPLYQSSHRTRVT